MTRGAAGVSRVAMQVVNSPGLHPEPRYQPKPASTKLEGPHRPVALLVKRRLLARAWDGRVLGLANRSSKAAWKGEPSCPLLNAGSLHVHSLAPDASGWSSSLSWHRHAGKRRNLQALGRYCVTLHSHRCLGAVCKSQITCRMLASSCWRCCWRAARRRVRQRKRPPLRSPSGGKLCVLIVLAL